MVQTDAELVNAVLNGNKELYAELIKRYERPARAIAIGISKDYHLTTDITQEAFFKAYQKLSTLRNPQAFGPWLLKITKRLALDSIKLKSKINNSEKNYASSYEKPNGQIDEEKQFLLTIIAKLPKAEQQAIMLHYFSQNNVTNVAKILGLSVNTVTKQLSRARIKMRKMLERSLA